MGKRRKKKRTYYYGYNDKSYNYNSWVPSHASHKDVDQIAIKVFGSLISSNFKTSHNNTQ